MREVWYAEREQVKAAVEVKNAARANAQIDRIIGESSRSVDKLCRRIFYPRLDTRTFDWPHIDRPTPGRLWLGGKSELIELLTLSSGGTAIDVDDVLLYPTSGPPYTRIELDQASSAAFGDGATPQQTISMYGLLGHTDDADLVGALAEDLTSSETAVDVADSSIIGVGALLRCGDERMIVTEKTPLDTAVDVTAPGMAAQMNAITVPMSSSVGAPTPGEMIIIDGERMLVVDVVGTNAYVQRAVDGSVLAAHTAGTSIYAYRTLTVTRGAVGTTKATHLTGATLTRWVPPDGVNGLVIAKSLTQLAQENSAYARVIGSGEGQREARGAGLKDKIAEVRREYGRRVRMGAI